MSENTETKMSQSGMSCAVQVIRCSSFRLNVEVYCCAYIHCTLNGFSALKAKLCAQIKANRKEINI